jgi:hypothetical protein
VTKAQKLDARAEALETELRRRRTPSQVQSDLAREADNRPAAEPVDLDNLTVSQKQARFARGESALDPD